MAVLFLIISKKYLGYKFYLFLHKSKYYYELEILFSFHINTAFELLKIMWG